MLMTESKYKLRGRTNPSLATGLAAGKFTVHFITFPTYIGRAL